MLVGGIWGGKWGWARARGIVWGSVDFLTAFIVIFFKFFLS